MNTINKTIPNGYNSQSFTDQREEYNSCMTTEINPIGAVIRLKRQVKDLSQDELSKLSGVSYNTIVKIERKSVPANPTIGTMQMIAKALGVSLTDLL